MQRDPAVIAAYLGDEQRLEAAAPEVAAIGVETAESPIVSVGDVSDEQPAVG